MKSRPTLPGSPTTRSSKTAHPEALHPHRGLRACRVVGLQTWKPRTRAFVLFILLRLEDPRLLSTCLSRSTFAWPSPAPLPPLPLSLKVRIHLTMASLLPSGPGSQKDRCFLLLPHILPPQTSFLGPWGAHVSLTPKTVPGMEPAHWPSLLPPSLHSPEAPGASWSTLLTRCLSQLTFTAAQVCPLLPSLLL